MIIGRKKEIAILKEAFNSQNSEFVAIYGRRRVGKTYLTRQLFEKEKNYFEITGSKDGSLKEQLYNFSLNFSEKYFDGIALTPQKSWIDAFSLLTLQLEKIPTTEKIVLFFDELPWLSSRKSKFVQALDYFWNTKWCKLQNLTLIVCGSAASWMLDNLISAKGGLHNRITKKILLEPFSLSETKTFLENKKFNLTSKQILDLYMVLGGIPYYLEGLNKSLSVAQNINNLCFNKNGLLINEFPQLFRSLFDSYETNLEIVKFLAKYHYGVSRDEIINKLKISSGGRLNKRLEELQATGFIKKFIPFGQKRGYHYRLIDEYSLFYLTWIEKYLKNESVRNYWMKTVGTPSYYTWAGFSFENICFKHLFAIEKALEIEDLVIKTGSWKKKKGTDFKGAQIDCVLDRLDNSVNLCEFKFTEKPYEVTKDAALNFRNKILCFKEEYPEKEIFFSLISATGIKKTIWSEDLVSSAVTGEDLLSQMI